MVFLPIVERELRVAARKPSTFWVRLAGVLVALVLAAGFLVLSAVGTLGLASPTLGRALFAVLTWLALVAALSFGLFFTSDCLSQEKRDGTLGFLFLTDLKGYDVVLGKLLATSLRGFCVMLGVFPILAVTLLMGGVTGAQFWKTCLALASALMLSLAAGLFVSAISRLSQKAMGVTLLLLVILAGGGPAGDGLLAVSRSVAYEPFLSLFSPVFLFLVASQGGALSPFWAAVLANQIAVWLLLGLAFWILPKTWQQKARAESATGRCRHWRWKFGTSKSRAALRRRLMDLNPILWLLGRERWQPALVWGLSLVAVAAFIAVFALTNGAMWWYAWSYFAGGIGLLLYLGFASQSGKFFVESKQNGFLEQLLATPIKPAQLVTGQWRGLVRLFGLPVGIFLLLQLVGGIMVQYESWSQMAGTSATVPPPVPPMTNSVVAATNSGSGGGTSTPVVTVPSVPGFEAPNIPVIVGTGAIGMVVTMANFVALIWFGMWMGLTSKSVNPATLKTILFVQVIPWFVLTFVSMLITMAVLFPALMGSVGRSSMSSMTWYPLLMAAVAAVLSLMKDAGFVIFARKRLLSQFRDRAGQTFGPTLPPLPPVLNPVEAA